MTVFFPLSLIKVPNLYVWLPPGQPVNYNVIWDLLYAVYIVTNKQRLLSVWVIIEPYDISAMKMRFYDKCPNLHFKN